MAQYGSIFHLDPENGHVWSCTEMFGERVVATWLRPSLRNLLDSETFGRHQSGDRYS